MGTRGITEVISNGQTVVAQYGQWDHYPSGQGLTALNFLANPANVDKLRAGLANVYVPSDEEREALVASYHNGDGWMNMEQGDRFNQDFPSLTRDTGAGILQVIADSTDKIPLYLDTDFKNDRLFCEGVYTINLDNNTFTTEYNRYNDEETEDVLTLTFDECATISHDEYLTRAKCGVYQYYQTQETANA